MSDPVSELEEIIKKIRTVKTGDWVLADDFNLKVEALKKFFTCVEYITGRKIEDIPTCCECYGKLMEIGSVGHGDRTLPELYNKLNEVLKLIQFCLWQITGRLAQTSVLHDLTSYLSEMVTYTLTSKEISAVSIIDVLSDYLTQSVYISLYGKYTMIVDRDTVLTTDTTVCEVIVTNNATLTILCTLTCCRVIVESGSVVVEGNGMIVASMEE